MGYLFCLTLGEGGQVSKFLGYFLIVKYSRGQFFRKNVSKIFEKCNVRFK